MDTISVADLLDDWFAWKRGKYEVTTIATTKTAIAILQRDFGSMDVNAVRTRHVDRWFAEMDEAGYAPNYCRRIAGVLSTCYSKAIAWDLAMTNPVEHAEKPKVRGKVKSPTADTMKRAIALAGRTAAWLFLMMRLGAVTGARRSELLGIDRDDFAPDTCQLTIRRTVVPNKPGIKIVDHTKTPKGARTITIDAETAELLEKRFADHDSIWLFPGRGEVTARGR